MAKPIDKRADFFREQQRLESMRRKKEKQEQLRDRKHPQLVVSPPIPVISGVKANTTVYDDTAKVYATYGLWREYRAAAYSTSTYVKVEFTITSSGLFVHPKKDVIQEIEL